MRLPRPAFVPATPPAPTPAPLVHVERLEPAAVAETAPSYIPGEADRLATEIPSLSSACAAILASEGIHTLRQIEEIDPRTEGPLLARLGITWQELAGWKAEAALLYLMA